jgi:hypothetical protein
LGLRARLLGAASWTLFAPAGGGGRRLLQLTLLGVRLK